MVYINDIIHNIDVESAINHVSQQRAEYALRYRKIIDRQLSLAVCMLLMKGLKEEYGINEMPEFEYEKNGKPILKGYHNIHFNFSHCSKAAICVIDDKPVGCDVETVPEIIDMDLCRGCFNEAEQQEIFDSNKPNVAFTRLWTRKEAFLKLTGEGLNDNIPDLFEDEIINQIKLHTFVADNCSYAFSLCYWK